MLESQAQDNQARLLADLQAKGDLAAFSKCTESLLLTKKKERKIAASRTYKFIRNRKIKLQEEELAGLEAVGSTKQKREQQLLDESYQRFLKRKKFSRTTVRTVSSFSSWYTY